MSSTEQLRALRDAAQAMHANTNTKPVNRITAAVVFDLAVDAIAALEAEQPKACASFYGRYEGVPNMALANTSSLCRTCGQPLSAHQRPVEQPKACEDACHYCGGVVQTRCPSNPWGRPCEPRSAHQQPVPLVHGPEHGCAQPQQPARTAVPPKAPRNRVGCYNSSSVLVLAEHYDTLHAAAQAIAAERDAALERAEKAEAGCGKLTASLEANEMLTAMERERREQAERERDEARAELAAQTARVEREMREHAEAASKLDEWRAKAGALRAELAALKTQEPVAWLDPSARNCIRWDTTRFVGLRDGAALYAAPVASIPLAQHEAALAEARRAERERCAVIAEENGAIHTPRAIRALRDGGEG